MRSTLSYSGQTQRILERRIRNWELARSQRRAEAPPEERTIHPFIAISRMVGAGGSYVGRAVADELGWSVFDRELLDVMASDDEVRRRVYAIEDEHERSLLEDVLLSIGYHGPGERDDYFHRLARASVAIATREPAVFVGRGVGFILPAASGVTVRIVASVDYCDARYAVRRNLPADHARKERRDKEADRIRYLKKHGRRRFADLSGFDLTVAVDRIGPREAINVITALARSRFGTYLSHAAPSEPRP
ncbi:MAG: AAA family ATPase [Phycisphaerae bacterium]